MPEVIFAHHNFKKFVKHRIGDIGHADERIWEMKIDRLQADANLRGGRTISPLHSELLQ